MKTEKIVCAAIHFDDDEKREYMTAVNITTGFVLCASRHGYVFATLKVLGLYYLDYRCTQGFMTSKYRFVDRKEAGKIAFDAGQIIELTEELFSEDLY